MLNVTDIRVKLGRKEDSNLKGVASITVDECFVIHDIKILKGDTGLYIGMPSKKVNDVYKDIAHPLDTNTREALKNMVLEAFDKELNKENQ